MLTAQWQEAKVVPVDKNDNKVDMVGLSQNTVRVVAKMMEIKTVPSLPGSCDINISRLPVCS